jgi:hypothetical protein
MIACAIVVAQERAAVRRESGVQKSRRPVSALAAARCGIVVPTLMQRGPACKPRTCRDQGLPGR